MPIVTEQWAKNERNSDMENYIVSFDFRKCYTNAMKYIRKYHLCLI